MTVHGEEFLAAEGTPSLVRVKPALHGAGTELASFAVRAAEAEATSPEDQSDHIEVSGAAGSLALKSLATPTPDKTSQTRHRQRSSKSRQAESAASSNAESDESTEADDQATLELPEVDSSEAGPVCTVNNFEDIYLGNLARIARFLYRLLGNREEAMDSAEDVFVKAYRALKKGGTIPERAVQNWLYRIAFNTAADALRRRRLIAWLPLSVFNDDRGIGAGMPTGDTQPWQLGEVQSLFNAVTSSANPSGYDGSRFEQRVVEREIIDKVFAQLKRENRDYYAILLLCDSVGYSHQDLADFMVTHPGMIMTTATASALKMQHMRARNRFIEIYNQIAETNRRRVKGHAPGARKGSKVQARAAS